MQRWPHAHGGPLGAGDFRHTPEDFRVTELMDFVPEGHGEHQWLWVEKRGLTTDELCRELASLCEVAPRDIGVAGLKDKQAITQQWVSVWLPGREAPQDLGDALAEKGVRVLASVRHPRKLKRGVHRGNRFALRVSGEAVAHPEFEARWQTLIRDGVPNYFGPQRFGHQGHNLGRARAVLVRGWRKRDDRSGMLLSTARSFLFNEVLAARLKANCWATALSGEVFALNGRARASSPTAASRPRRWRSAWRVAIFIPLARCGAPGMRRLMRRSPSSSRSWPRVGRSCARGSRRPAPRRSVVRCA